MVKSEDVCCEEEMFRQLDLRKDVELSMVFIRESTDFANDDLAVFPPINHENLYIDHGFERDRESPSESSSPSSSSRDSDSSSSSSSLSPSDSDGQFEFDRKSQCQPLETAGKSRWTCLSYYTTLEINIIRGWWKLLLARVQLKFQKLVTCFSRSNLCSLSRTLRSYFPVMVIVNWWWMRNRARRRLHEEEIAAHLRDTIKEKDERIAQLLHQVAQLNELLVKKQHSN